MKAILERINQENFESGTSLAPIAAIKNGGLIV
jgi:hypothetical protein